MFSSLQIQYQPVRLVNSTMKNYNFGFLKCVFVSVDIGRFEYVRGSCTKTMLSKDYNFFLKQK